MDWQQKIIAILLNESSDLRVLAGLVGCDPASFYSTADFRRADLSDQDLSSIDLTYANVSEAKLPVFVGYSQIRSKRLFVTIDYEIQTELKFRNPMQVSAHVDRLLSRFYSDPPSEFRANAYRVSKIRRYIVRKMEIKLRDIIGATYSHPDDRTLVSYYVLQNTHRLIVGSDLYKTTGMSLAEAIRLAIYWMLLKDSVSRWSRP